MSEALRAPFPWNGGKSRVAEVAWVALGADVANYVEPFFGSGAMLLGRPGGAGKIETVNDLDGGIVNFYRAITANPDAVAEWCDWPVSELCLHSRHAWLVERLNEMADQLRADPHYCDPKVAGWWVWGIAQWIGTGWCGGIKHGEPRPSLGGDQGVHTQGTRELPNQRPHVSGENAGMGVLSQKLPNLSGYDVGVRSPTKQQIPQLRVHPRGGTGNGVHSSLPEKMPMLAVSSTGGTETGRGALSESAAAEYSGLPAIGNDRGINGVAAPPCRDWFRALRARLRRVRIVCGDWTRVLGPSVLGKGKNVGGRRPCAVFLDSPYKVSLRAKRIYTHDAPGLSAEVCDWALQHGNDPDLRIAVCGYAGEHEFPSTWTEYAWKGARGYAGADNDNREKERIWFSAHCLPLVGQQQGLFDVERTA